MLQVTDTAAEHVKKVLADLAMRDGVCLRLAETQEGLSVLLDQQRPGDEALLVMDAAAGRPDGRAMHFGQSTRQLVFT